MINYSMEDLIPLVGKLAEKYTSKESSSISYEKAKQLMEAVLYCINELDQEEFMQQEQMELRGTKGNVEEDYKQGYELVIKKVLNVKSVYERILENFDSYGNIGLDETLRKGIPGFLRCYDPRFEPQNHILTMDYPTLVDPLKQCGVDAINSYVKYIEIEQKFLHAFPRDYVILVLESYQEDYRQLFINLSSIIYRNVIGCMIAKKSLVQRGFAKSDLNTIDTWLGQSTEEDLKKRLQELVGFMLQKGYENPMEIFDYLKRDITDFAIELINARKNKCLEALFVI